MSVANFGAFLGGLTQGQQNAENQRERAAYLAMIQKRQKDADDDAQAGKDALFANIFGSDNMPAPVVQPPTTQPQAAQPGPAPQPGQASVPAGPPPGAGAPPQQMMMPGATPMGPQGGPPPGVGMLPPSPYAGAGNPMAAPKPAAPPVPQQTGDGYEQAKSTLAQIKEFLDTPEAAQIAKDPALKEAQQRMHSYIEQLRKAGIDPSNPAAAKPDPIQQKRLQLLHEDVGLAAAAAAKHVSADRTAQMKWGQEFANVLVHQENARQAMKRVEAQQAGATERAGMKGSGSGKTDAPAYDDLTPDKRTYVESLISAFQRTGKFPTGTGYNDPFKKTALAEMERRGMDINAGVGNKAADTADAGTIKTLTGRKGVVEETSKIMQNLEPQIMDVAKRVMAQPGMSSSMKLNEIVQGAQTKFRDNGDVRQLVNLMQGWKSANARLMSQNTGAGGTPVFSLHRSDELASGAMPLSQLAGAFKAAQTEREATKKGLTDTINEHQSAIDNRGKGAGSSSGGAMYKTSDGKQSFKASDVERAAKAAGMTVEEFAKRKGLSGG